MNSNTDNFIQVDENFIIFLFFKMCIINKEEIDLVNEEEMILNNSDMDLRLKEQTLFALKSEKFLENKTKIYNTMNNMKCYYKPLDTWIRLIFQLNDKMFTTEKSDILFSARTLSQEQELDGGFRSLEHLQNEGCMYFIMKDHYVSYRTEYIKFYDRTFRNLQQLSKISFLHNLTPDQQKEIFNKNPNFKTVYDKIGTIAHMHASR